MPNPRRFHHLSAAGVTYCSQLRITPSTLWRSSASSSYSRHSLGGRLLFRNHLFCDRSMKVLNASFKALISVCVRDLSDKAPFIDASVVHLPLSYQSGGELATTQILPSQNLVAAPARGCASAQQRSAFPSPRTRQAVASLVSTNKNGPHKAGAVLYLWRRGESSPRAMDNGKSFYGA